MVDEASLKICQVSFLIDLIWKKLQHRHDDATNGIKTQTFYQRTSYDHYGKHSKDKHVKLSAF